MPKHIAIPASELRRGDLVRLGASTNYVLVAEAVRDDKGWTHATIYDDDVAHDEPTLLYGPGETVHLSMRDQPPTND